MKPKRRLVRWSVACGLLGVAASAFAIDTAALIASVLSPDCLAWRIVGVCYWLSCSAFGCTVQTSVKVRHYVPDAVVSSYNHTGSNPWAEVAFMSPAMPFAQDGGDGTTNQGHENNLAKFKNADVIGHPGMVAFGRFARQFGMTCPGAGVPFAPYMLSTFDVVAWRYGIPESVYPESLTPGMREIGRRTAANLWGNVYPRSGFLHQVDDFESAAVVAQRAGDVVTRQGQPHVYQALLAQSDDGYWPAGALIESDNDTGKWQALAPHMSSTCAVFPNTQAHEQATDGAYVWALWRPYACCKRAGQIFLGSSDVIER
ncbi:TIGR03756 family integrating conjugative element protein [Burkholderia pseudomallei]|uniref:TIGR03756 family integrating conjugative element protein n=1 Tax=Burkholderia pseudomallei TaxID=28450 RepID=UPI0029469F1A|nr:traU family protein [Burkholderia pseudomallei]